MRKHFYPADVLLPKSSIDMKKYSVIACDQYTSEPEYWEQVEKNVGTSPSTLNLILPEVRLDQKNSFIGKINSTMVEYENSVFESNPNVFMYVERTLPSNGRVRYGVIGCIDLEDYDYNIGSVSPVRATEGTVLSRIPPRVEIRRNASVELPHVILFCDDPEDKIISPLTKNSESLKKTYDFDLMMNGGHITGYMIDGEQARALSERIEKYASDRELVFAVGDGNHSLATAKACYEELKKQYGDAALEMKARYALCEIVNIHSDAIEFEPIYRLLINVDPGDVMNYICANCKVSIDSGEFAYDYYTDEESGRFYICGPNASLPVGELQKLLDEYVQKHPECEIDYIHGKESLYKLAEQEHCMGFIFEGMKKSDLFSSVSKDGSLPRKTFSMGEANDKRFYLEARKIK